VNELAEFDTENKDQPSGMTFRAFCAWILGFLLAACGVVVRVAPMHTPVRVLLAGTLLFALFTCCVFILSMIGKRPMSAFPAIFFLTLFVLWTVLANNPPDQGALRTAYGNRLHAYLGAPYARGGEAETGVDCSGLARAALWQAMVRQGIKEFNPGLLGLELWNFWWRDVSAADLVEGKYGYTRVFGRADKLAGFDAGHLEVGDMAVSHKRHVMVYYGEGQWIEASPIDKKVVVNKAPANSRRKWFNEPVVFVRWWIFQSE